MTPWDKSREREEAGWDLSHHERLCTFRWDESHPTNPRRVTRGFALLLTLVVLVLATTLAVAAARTVSARQRAVAQESIDLQRRWANVSVTRAVLLDAESLLRAAEAKRKSAVGSLAFSLELGGETMSLVIADESAKANMNTLLRTGDATIARNRLTDVLQGSGLLARIRLSPMQTVDANESPIQTLAQVIIGASDADLIGPRGTGPAAWLTTFGDGRPNIRRAEARTIELVTTSLNVAEIGRVIATRDRLLADGKDVPLAGVLGTAGMGNVARVSSELSDRATVHSLRIFGRDRGAQWYDAIVLDSADPAKPQWRTIGWQRP